MSLAQWLLVPFTVFKMLHSHRAFFFFFFLFNGRCFGFESDLDYLKAFDDSIIYRLGWEKEDQILKDETPEIVPMMTARKEKYMCSLPKMLESKKVSLIGKALVQSRDSVQ